MIRGTLLVLLGVAPFVLPAVQERSELGELVESYSLTDNLKGLGEALHLEEFGKAVETYEDLKKAYELLTDADRRREPDFSPAGMPRVPSHCAESEACGACYEEAQGKLNRVRRTLEKLRAIGLQTKEMKDDAMAVGKSFSSIQGFGLGWYAARRDIVKGWNRFVGTYDGKYRELLESLRAALEQIGTCEAEHFDESDWYDRFGFIYFQFMEGRYHPDNVLN